jgi:hypothetical protein
VYAVRGRRELPARRGSLQSGFVREPRLLAIFLISFWTGCGGSPSYPPPEQRAPMSGASPDTFGAFVSMDSADSGQYVVQGFASASEGPWRWAFDHPVLRFWVPDVTRASFTMEYALPERTFRYTGPVTLTLTMNDKFLDKVRGATAGLHRYSAEVPADVLRKNALNLVSIEPDKVWTSKEDGTKYGFILLRAGFVEHR